MQKSAKLSDVNNKNFYLTTAIPYANAAPHIGTAMDYLFGDIILRYQLANGKNAKMSIGTDEHGTKIEQKAESFDKTPRQLVDDLQPEFAKMRSALNLDFGVTVDRIHQSLAEQNFAKQNIINIRTTDPDHVRRVQEIWRKLDAAGVIYKGKYEGWYCTGHEQFFTETEAKEMNYFCEDHQKPLDKISEENYYLAVSKFTEQIRDFAKTHVIPAWRGKEILELIKDGAQDVSISRPTEKLTWGIPVPDDDSQVMYVWIDALSNYITGLNFPDKPNFAKDFWNDNSEIVEIVGKDIVRFHAIIWPAMLLALGLKLPDTLLTHGFVNVGGSKMSKSIGNVVSPLEIVDNYGADAFRFYFAKHVSTFDDGDFTWEKFEASYNGELANDLGNLVSRTANMLRKYEIKLQSSGVIERENLREISEKYHENFAKFELSSAIENAWSAVQFANQFIDENKPWTLAKSDLSELPKVLNDLWSQLITIADLLAPFLPETSSKIREIFAKKDGDKITENPAILFPKKYLHSEEPNRK